MVTISDPMTDDHRRCDDIFVQMEQQILKRDWDAAQRLMREFGQAIKYHFTVEETCLFPRLERAVSQAAGPVRVMTMEHNQMRQLIDQLIGAIGRQDKDECLGLAETLLITMQQHNMKEENILYPMADSQVPDLGDEIAQRIQGHS